MGDTNTDEFEARKEERLAEDFPLLDSLSKEDRDYLTEALLFDEYGNADLVLSGAGSRRWLSLAIRAGFDPNQRVILDGPYAIYDRLGSALIDDNRDEVGHLLYKFRHEDLKSMPKTPRNWVREASWYTSAFRNARTFSTLRYMCRFLCSADRRDIKQDLYYCYYDRLQNNKLRPNSDREYDLSISDVQRYMRLMPYDGLARVALKEVALGLKAYDLPVLLVIEIGAWLAATHHNYADEVEFASAWEIAKKVKHWTQE